ncbi:hypothetical protein YC2023_116530 [Brassica napus]
MVLIMTLILKLRASSSTRTRNSLLFGATRNQPTEQEETQRLLLSKETKETESFFIDEEKKVAVVYIVFEEINQSRARPIAIKPLTSLGKMDTSNLCFVFYIGGIGKIGHFEFLFVTIRLLIFLAILDMFLPFFNGKNSKLNFKNVKKNMKTVGNISMIIYV